MVAGAIAAIANLFQFSLLFGHEEDDGGPLGWIGLIGTIIFAPLAASLLQLAVSRQREYLADTTGAELLSRASTLADALEALEPRAQALPLNVNPATASLYIVNPLRRQGIVTLFSTHPPIAERVVHSGPSTPTKPPNVPHSQAASACSLPAMPPIISRGFRGRRDDDTPSNRVPPGQHVTTDFPVLSAGPTPHTPLDRWDFSIIGKVDEPRRWTWEQFRALPSERASVDIHCVTKWSKLDTVW